MEYITRRYLFFNEYDHYLILKNNDDKKNTKMCRQPSRGNQQEEQKEQEKWCGLLLLFTMGYNERSEDVKKYCAFQKAYLELI
ncbi:hypothetical protein L8N14_021425 [Serratia marcescens]|uniref:hypothetical protein n=1 Tax=Serratia marcescens TaxID=615 RepID=UPI001C956E56|nr:hypothetical protein [Serratia marcescens]MBY4850257.1 hypothetical protein [Serratia marcescens]MCH9868369.1 hypothetical protein [Serratia marcescens]